MSNEVISGSTEIFGLHQRTTKHFIETWTLTRYCTVYMFGDITHYNLFIYAVYHLLYHLLKIEYMDMMVYLLLHI